MHCRWTLAIKGKKTVECLVQFGTSSTHSYTVQTTVSADGKLWSPLFSVLKKSSGKFGPIVDMMIFRSQNIQLEASKSGKLPSGINTFFEFNLNNCK